MSDLLFALRQLRKSPGFAFVAIVTLALGIGANTSIFSIVNAVLLRPLPYPHPERLVIVSQRDADQPAISMSFLDYLDYRRDNTVFEHFAVARRQSFNLSGLQGREPEQLQGALVTASFFNAIGLSPQIGRTFSETEDRVGGPMLVVISDRLWQNAFQRDPAVLGRSLTFNNQPYTVIGVMPRDFEFPLNPGHVNQSEFWLPLSLQPEEFAAGAAASWNSRMVGRLKPGISLEQAQSDAERVAQETMRDYPAFMRSLRIHAVVTLLHEDTVAQARPMVRALFFAVNSK